MEREGGIDDTGFHPPLSAPSREDDCCTGSGKLYDCGGVKPEAL